PTRSSNDMVPRFHLASRRRSGMAAGGEDPTARPDAAGRETCDRCRGSSIDSSHRRGCTRGTAKARMDRLRPMQPRPLVRKTSDEYVVPLCRVHHREMHGAADERAWWNWPASQCYTSK